MEINSIISISVPALTTVVLIVAIETIGIVQFLKNFFQTKKKRGYALASLLVVIGCSFMNTNLVPQEWTAVYDITFLGLAVTQLAWDVVVKGVPDIVAKAMRTEIKLEDRK
jgi:hypothetical protein